MVVIDETQLPSEWATYPRIDQLFDPARQEHPERLICGKLPFETLLRSSGTPSAQCPIETIKQLRNMGLV